MDDLTHQVLVADLLIHKALHSVELLNSQIALTEKRYKVAEKNKNVVVCENVKLRGMSLHTSRGLLSRYIILKSGEMDSLKAAHITQTCGDLLADCTRDDDLPDDVSDDDEDDEWF